jgi:hypothetical protein
MGASFSLAVRHHFSPYPLAARLKAVFMARRPKRIMSPANL